MERQAVIRRQQGGEAPETLDSSNRNRNRNSTSSSNGNGSNETSYLHFTKRFLKRISNFCWLYVYETFCVSYEAFQSCHARGQKHRRCHVSHFFGEFVHVLWGVTWFFWASQTWLWLLVLRGATMGLLLICIKSGAFRAAHRIVIGSRVLGGLQLRLPLRSLTDGVRYI